MAAADTNNDSNNAQCTTVSGLYDPSTYLPRFFPLPDLTLTPPALLPIGPDIFPSLQTLYMTLLCSDQY